ncbi:transcriptional repressor [Hyphomicrobium methylovorum]|uniref:Fur family transcriptional regulator n=1 Tax=Hyphomicrobium methylovorum TaxID=84 RepID=UPI0015E64668|nr:Fur family transcriptional regulator [Hyphomicrobium methylovorum]MBA2125765.1 transcriptional repressor [Hyphomicrobium methylovorum]
MANTRTDEEKARERLRVSMDRAVEIFSERNIRFTDLRRKVFEEIASTRASVGAYEVLDRLAKKGTRLAPISVYRALDALLEAGVVHRLESKNSYFACNRLHHPPTTTGRRRPMFLSCEKCGVVQEVDGEHIFHAIDEAATGAKFEPRVRFVEVSGTCQECAKRLKI